MYVGDLPVLATKVMGFEEISPGSFVVPVDIERYARDLQRALGVAALQQDPCQVVCDVDDSRRDLLLKEGFRKPAVPPGGQLRQRPAPDEPHRRLQVSEDIVLGLARPGRSLLKRLEELPVHQHLPGQTQVAVGHRP